MRIRLTPINWFVILSLIAICLALGLPPDPAALRQFHASEAAYRLAVVALLIPYILIWYLSFYAFAKLREYSRPLKGTKDGNAFHTITIGSGTLAFSLVVPTIISFILTAIAAHQPGFKTAAVITNNYLSLFPGLIAFLLLYNGAQKLIGTVKGKVRRLDLRWHAPWFLLICAVFSHLTIENHYRSNPYHLWLWLLVITYIVPYMYGWMVGLLGAYELRSYASSVNGLLYRRAVGQFATGIAIAIVGSIAIQFVNITLAHRLRNSLGAVILIDYGLLILVAIGLLFMAIGTKKLKLIEEV